MHRLVAPAVLGVTLAAGAVPLGSLPPLGPLLDPVSGIWAVARTAELPNDSRAEIRGLGEWVKVSYDRRGVPHIFAATSTDAYRALGYVVARDRLFQLELQTRATAGTLSEMFGAEALRFDRSQRALGLAASAERNFEGLANTSRVADALDAYADGVNTWIENLTARDVPLEYRLLGRRPARWKPIRLLTTRTSERIGRRRGEPSGSTNY